MNTVMLADDVLLLADTADIQVFNCNKFHTIMNGKSVKK